MPPAIISHPAFKTLMTAQIQTFLHANPVTTTLSRAARWDQLKVHIQDVARGYCFTFHAQRTGQLRVLRVRASKARAAYVAAPGSQHALDELRHTAAALLQHRQQQAATDALRAGVLLHEYGDQSTYYFHHLHKQRQQATVISHLQQHQDSPVADLCSVDGRQQADSIIVNFFSADSPTGMYRQLPTDLSAQQALLSSLDRRLPSHAQQACEGAEQGITLDELQAALKLSARGKKPGSDGLPYEFYSQFWEVLGPELLAVLQEAFQAQHGLGLPASMTQGVITLLYKGKGSKALLDSYRPITLLNSDYKLRAATMCYATWRRWSTCNKQVSPAAWSFWTSAKHMTASAAHGCWIACPAWGLDSGLAVQSGVQQGSPLSPLLYVLAAQPLASHLRHQTRQGVIRSITMPNGQPAPVSHQHADDTTIHVLRPSDAQVALDSSIALFCAATCSQLNVSKSRGFLIQAPALASASVAALPSISFITGQQTIKHLGVLLGYDMQAASHQQFTGIYHAISAKVRHWAARGLSFLGRVHVAKQVLAASLWYHASFQRPSEQLLKQLSRQLRRLVASAQQASHSDDALALAQGNSQGSAQLPSAAPGAAPKGVWGWCMCQHRSRPCRPR